MKKHREKNNNFIGLFSGAGGLDYGFFMDKWEPLFLVDFWDPAINTLKKCHPKTPVFQWDLSKITKKDIEKTLENLHINEVDAIIGGPPCQAFSRLNQNQLFENGKETEININDPRRSLFMDFLRIVKYIKPKIVVMENVYDICNRKLGGSGKDKDELITNIIKQEFDKIGYKVELFVIRADNYNVPQIRKRVIFIGIRKDLNIEPSVPDIIELKTSVKKEFEKICKSDPNQELKKHTKEWENKINKIPMGGYYKHLPLEMKVLKQINIDFLSSFSGQDRNFCFKNNDKLYDFKILQNNTIIFNKKIYNFKDFIQNIVKQQEIYRVMPRMGTYLRRIGWDVSHTITRNPLIHPIENRDLSVREKASIQTFPHNYEFCGTIQNQHILVGNAVPCNLAYIIAKHVNYLLP